MLTTNPNFRWIVSQEGTRQSCGLPVSFHKFGTRLLVQESGAASNSHNIAMIRTVLP